MRFGLKAKETLAITALTFFVVATTSLVHISQLTRLTIEDALRQADLIAKQIYAQSSRTLSRSADLDPWEALQQDPELRGLLEASVGYSPYLLYVLLADQGGRTVLHGERGKEGSTAPARPALRDLLSLDPLRRFTALYESGKIYEAGFPLSLNDRPFGSIRLGISTSLLRRELNDSLTRSLALAGVALPVGWLVAMALAGLTLKPVRRLAQEMERLRRGEYEVGGDLGREDEFKELASQLQLLGQQLQSDRIKVLGEKAHLQQVVDQLEDGLIFFNLDHRILFFNKAAEAAVGIPLEQARGGTLEDLLAPSHPLRSLAERGLDQAIGGRSTTISLSLDGTAREFLVSAFSVADAQQRMGTMVLLKDLSSIKTLQSLVSHSAKLAALGRLTSGVAHEVKNPLNAIAIHLELLKERLGVTSDEAQHSVAVIESQIRRLDRVVQGFLKFIRPRELTLKPVDLNSLLQGVLILLEPEWQARGIRFVFHPDPTLPAVTGDEELLHQAFMNILLNACQAMPSGGTIAITTTPESRETAKIRIADEGVGIP
ncbi:MAG TPA: histidine kinase dimerization/phospho-acceptor domain-containing protein, partial [Candidatus Methylomirabilis sp.]|nr:histidine kinase dimerization/phospho-acceptor domain-containing protein [Candidatus Methylomirabilis sp.]